MSRRHSFELEGLAEDLLQIGFIHLHRTRFLATLGYERDRAEAYTQFLEIYENLGGDPKDVKIAQLGDSVLLCSTKMEWLTDWKAITR